MALVIGAAVLQGKVDLDTPLVDYGVVPPTAENTPSLGAATAGRSTYYSYRV